MKLQATVLAIFTCIARLLGVIWMLGGIVTLLTAILDASHRGLYIGLGIFVSVAGLGLLVARPVTPGDIERVRRFAENLKRP